ncbi:hypothetical protein PCE1_000192 [Barthelona sp. PCE]
MNGSNARNGLVYFSVAFSFFPIIQVPFIMTTMEMFKGMHSLPSHLNETLLELNNPHPTHGSFRSPLCRYASNEMSHIWSNQHQLKWWIQLWLILARNQKKFGMDIADDAISALESAVNEPPTMEEVAVFEDRLRHDVMAAIHAVGAKYPAAAPIIHAGATSQYVKCNTDITRLYESLTLIRTKLLKFMKHLSSFCYEHSATPCVGFTHLQVAMPTTVGKRASLWLQDFEYALSAITFNMHQMRLRSIKGATGTQASFEELFGGYCTVKQLEDHVSLDIGRLLNRPNMGSFPVCGQVYPRIVNSGVFSALAALAQAAKKMSTDLRLLSHMFEIEEPQKKTQVGSSAMPFKANPMRSERIGGLARVLLGFAPIVNDTAAEQWMERTLDDSSTNRVTLAEGMLTADSIMNVLHSYFANGGLRVNNDVIAANVSKWMPFLITENILMIAVQQGGDRQELHEVIRQLTWAASKNLKLGKPHTLVDDLKDAFNAYHINWEELLANVPVGFAMEQTREYLKTLSPVLLEIVAEITDTVV